MSTTPCKVCGAPAPFPDSGLGQVECTNCWEVEKRLTAYLKSENGQRFVLRALMGDILGHAILDMDDRASLGPDTEARMEMWNMLVVAAEEQTGRLSEYIPLH